MMPMQKEQGFRRVVRALRTGADKDSEIDRLRANNTELRDLVEYAAESSTITTSDDPGCFWCDHEKHTRDCPAARALKRKP